MKSRFIHGMHCIFACFFLGISFETRASYQWYGRIAVDSQSISNDIKGTKTDIKSNYSKFGIKGKFVLSEDSNSKLIYQAEYQFDPVDGKARGDEGTFKQRNTFIGIQTDLGTLFAGTYDSAFKKSQLKIDLFNDFAPDIKNILHGENRLEKFVGYTTPKYMGRISATFNSIKNPSSVGKKYKSYSVNYSGKALQAAIAIEESIKGYDGTRLTILIPFKKFQLGFLAQKTTKLSSGMKKNGHVISLARKIGSKGTVKIQHAASSMKIEAGKHLTIGYDYQLKKYLTIFSFYSKLDSSKQSNEKDIFSFGLEYKF
jgi:hypothetical protein